MRSLIADDEASARSRLKRLLHAHSDVEVIGEAQDGLEAVEQIETLTPDLLFLDVEMPGLTGLQVLQSLQRSVPPPLVVFVTGYDQHALAAFEANALAYLLKPVEADRLAQSVDRARRLLASAEDRNAERERLRAAGRESRRVLRRIVCRGSDGLILVPPEQVLWFDVEDGIVRAHTASQSYWVNYQMSELEATLPADMFFRSRREVLVNVARIARIKPYFKSGFLLTMADAAGTEIVVSERRVPELRRRLPGL